MNNTNTHPARGKHLHFSQDAQESPMVSDSLETNQDPRRQCNICGFFSLQTEVSCNQAAPGSNITTQG